jgi:molybdopterin-containing oxidoreductase family iron-sulfur binding subunit
LVRAYWKTQRGDVDFEKFWRKSVHDGLVADTALPAKPVQLRSGWEFEEAKTPEDPGGAGLDILFRADPTVYDGRFANNGWLQELPKPQTRLTWDNAAWVSPALAQKMSLDNGDVVELQYDGRTLRAPVWIVPGQPTDAVTIHFGYGRARAGKVGSGIGFNAFAMRTMSAPWFGTGLTLVKTGEASDLATTQQHHSMEGRNLVRVADLEEYREHPHVIHEMGEEPAADMTLYKPEDFPYDSYSWGMAIDLSACVGCNACVIACQAENNIAVVGKQQVAAGREMHWIRVDRYFEGDLDNPATYHQPVPCMHCENAPCEPVCPVGATVHSSEGLNDMVYNRCVGTRYCSNNCPYKVRRFNFFLYQDWDTESLKMSRNPDVSVRSRGVMEKCTYCVQRINAGRIEAQKENRTIRDGEVVTACQQVCPAGAIVFGNVNDRDSGIAKLRADGRHYSLLADLNTRPRTTYLARMRNPNPDLA